MPVSICYSDFFLALPGGAIIPPRAWLCFTVIALSSEWQDIKTIQRKVLKILISQASNGQRPALSGLSCTLSYRLREHSVPVTVTFYFAGNVIGSDRKYPSVGTTSMPCSPSFKQSWGQWHIPLSVGDSEESAEGMPGCRFWGRWQWQDSASL